MSHPNSTEPAFPVSTRITGQVGGEGGVFGHQDSESTYQFPGMTLRDYFAAHALANSYTEDERNADRVAEWAYVVADAMLAARATKENGPDQGHDSSDRA